MTYRDWNICPIKNGYFVAISNTGKYLSTTDLDRDAKKEALHFDNLAAAQATIDQLYKWFPKEIQTELPL